MARCVEAAGKETTIELVGFVFMPEHVHLLVYPMVPNPSISRYLARIKQPFSKQIKDVLVGLLVPKAGCGGRQTVLDSHSPFAALVGPENSPKISNVPFSVLSVPRDVNNIGLVLRDKGDLEGALRCHREAELIDRASFGNEHPEVATDVNNIGTVLHDKGDLEGARKCFREGFRIFVRLLGPRAIETLPSARNLRAVGVDPIALAREAAGAEAAEELAGLLDG